MIEIKQTKTTMADLVDMVSTKVQQREDEAFQRGIRTACANILAALPNEHSEEYTAAIRNIRLKIKVMDETARDVIARLETNDASN